MAIPSPNSNYLLNLNPWDDDPIYRDIVLQTWLAQIVSAVGSGGGGGALAPIAPYSTLSNNTALTAAPVAVQTLILGTPSVTDTGVVEQFTGNTNSFLQSLWQNTNAGTLASTDIVLNNNQGTSTTHYANLGINSSGFSGAGAFNAPGNSYLTATTGDLALGTTTANAIHFVIAGAATDAATISTSQLASFFPLSSASASSATNAGVTISSTLTQTAAGNFTDLLVNRTATTVGTGVQRLADFLSGGNSVVGIGDLTFGALATQRGASIMVAPNTFTLTGATTVAAFGGVFLGAPTLTNAGAGTITNAATLYIGGQPISAGSQVISNSWALYAQGQVNFTSSINGQGVFVLTTAARTSGSSPYVRWNIPADTTLSTTTEALGFLNATGVRQWTAGTVAIQREILFQAPTYAQTAAGTFTEAANLTISGAPISGTNASITTTDAVLIQAGAVNGAGTAPVTANALKILNPTGASGKNFAVQAGTAGTGITNIRHGISSAMTGGAVTVSDAGATANTRYFLTAHTLGVVTIPSTYYVSARSAGVSFTITASVATDTSTIDWLAIEP